MRQHVLHVTGVCENNGSWHPPSLHPGAPPLPNNNVDVAFWEPRNVAEKMCFSVCARPPACPQHCFWGRGGAADADGSVR